MTAAGASEPRPWWQAGVVYQVYPRSFQDSDGDGIGDLPGIIARLDYLAWLGVDAIWLSPIYPSPMVDFGYDVADYCDVDPLFGTLADLDRLVAAAHRRQIRVVLDFVPNHTSSAHPWFVASRSSRADPRRDWYLWADPGPGGGPPNNWRSVFGGSAWALDAATGQYYCHLFHVDQPDLNWRNPAVRAAMAEVVRFWLGRGIDGLRVDVIWLLAKDARLRDHPVNERSSRGAGPAEECFVPLRTADLPETQDYIRGLRAVFDEFEGRLMLGEIYLPVERLVTYYGAGVHLPFNFQLITLPWEAGVIAAAIEAYERQLPAGGWPSWVLGNHDQRRIATRVGPAQARVAAMLLLTLRGTPTIYYGDEIGMTDVPIPPGRKVDPAGRERPELGRDPCRTPMRWDGGPHAGFTSGEPWLPLGAGWRTTNVARLADDPRSILTLHRRLLALRRVEPAIAVGKLGGIAAAGSVIAFRREAEGRRLAVVLNLGPEPATVAVPLEGPAVRVVVSTGLDREGEPIDGRVTLRGDEGLLVGDGGPA